MCAEKCSACTDWSCKQYCIPDDGCPNLDTQREKKLDKKPTEKDQYVPKEKSGADSEKRELNDFSS